MATCSVEGCDKSRWAKGFCDAHYKRFRKYGDAGTSPIRLERKKGTGHINHDGYIRKYVKGRGMIFEHVLVAEGVLGKMLPKGAEIHHIDGNRQNNKKENLVICPNHAYHLMIERRNRAYEACGHADWLLCYACGKFDDPRSFKSHMHPECLRLYNKAKREKRKEMR